MILADTCIFIDFLRGKPNLEFEKWVLEGKILLSPIVRLELLQGARASELKTLERVFSGFQEIPVNEKTFQTSEALLLPLKNKGVTVGVPDLLIVAQCIQSKAKIYTTDQLLLKLQKLYWHQLKLI